MKLKKRKIIALMLAVMMLMASSAFAVSEGAVVVRGGAESAPVIVVNYTELSTVAGTAKEMIDNGAMLFITSPECSAEEIAKELSIPKTNTSLYQDAILVAYSIYKQGDRYIFANHYVSFADEVGENESGISTADNIVGSGMFSDVAKVSDCNAAETAAWEADGYSRILSAAVTARADNENFTARISDNPSGISTQGTTLPGKIADETWNDTLSVYNLGNTYCGYLNCTVYAYVMGTGKVNGARMNIYDVVSVAKAYPNSGSYVDTYKVRIHCNVTDYVCLETTTLPSGINLEKSLELSVQTDLIGNAGVSTSWSYNPESQLITESSPYARVVDWTAKTVSPQLGKAYEMAPGMRVASPIGVSKGAFSKITCDGMILGITVKSNSLEVGGWF